MLECKVDKNSVDLSVSDTDNAELMTELTLLNCVIIHEMAKRTKDIKNAHQVNRNLLISMLKSISGEEIAEMCTADELEAEVN